MPRFDEPEPSLLSSLHSIQRRGREQFGVKEVCVWGWLNTITEHHHASAVRL
jgi:hypothetical protein